MASPALDIAKPASAGHASTLTAEIQRFTASAYQRLPAEYLSAFRSLIADLIAQGSGSLAPEVGSRFPDFALEDVYGNLVVASEHWRGRNLILKFYRGGWCPYCNLELAALARRSADFAAENAQLFALAPERQEFMQDTKATADAPFEFLWDRGNGLARQLGIAFVVSDQVREVYGHLNLDLDSVNGQWILPIPATFVIRDGVLRYRHIDADYMRRQDPADLLTTIHQLNAQPWSQET